MEAYGIQDVGWSEPHLIMQIDYGKLTVLCENPDVDRINDFCPPTVLAGVFVDGTQGLQFPDDFVFNVGEKLIQTVPLN